MRVCVCVCVCVCVFSHTEDLHVAIGSYTIILHYIVMFIFTELLQNLDKMDADKDGKILTKAG